MNTKTDIKKMTAALKRLEKCNGNCKECEKLHFYSASNEHSICYAWGCDALPQDIFGCLSNTIKDLKNECINALKFELDLN